MNRFTLRIASVCLAVLAIGTGAAWSQGKKASLEPIAPETAGWSAQKLDEAKAFSEKINSAAVMVLYDGKVLISWGNVATKYKVHSSASRF